MYRKLVSLIAVFALLAAVVTAFIPGPRTTVSAAGGGDGLKAEYFNSLNFTNPVLTRTDATVNFDWQTGSPAAGVNADNFTVRWTGQVEPLYSQTYTFYTTSDDGVRLWVNNQLIIDKWIDQPATEWSGSIALTAGQKYDIKLEYYEKTVGAVAKLSWSSASQAKQIIPQSQLFSGSTGSYAVTKIRFFPRDGFAYRMTGGRFTGSNTSQTNDFETIATISTAPANGAWTEITLNNSKAYRYVKYESPNGSWGNVAEIEFYNGSTKLTGSGFGTSGSWNNSGNDFSKALDGNTATFFDSPLENGSYVGIDLGQSSQAAQPTFSPAPGSYTSAQSVTIGTSTSGATIRYTTDGSQPSESHGTVYTGPIAVSSTTTISAIAIKSGLANSAVAIGTWQIGTTPPPTSGYTSYHLGNSLTDTLNGPLEPLADSSGVDHKYLRTTIPGAPTDWIWDHPGSAMGEPDYRTVLANVSIDHLFTQPFAGHDRSVANESEYSAKFYRLALQKNPNVQHWLYVQWPEKAFSDNWSKATGNAAGFGFTPATTWEQGVTNHILYVEKIRQAMDDAEGGKSIRIVPGGLGLVKLKQAIEAGNVPGITDFFNSQFSDDLHLNSKGAYMIALVHYVAMYQKNPAGLSYANTGLTAQQAQIYQQIAYDTVKNYQWSSF